MPEYRITVERKERKPDIQISACGSTHHWVTEFTMHGESENTVTALIDAAVARRSHPAFRSDHSAFREEGELEMFTRLPEEGDRVAFRENESTVTEGTVTRVWDKPKNNPYITIVTDDNRAFVRFRTLVKMLPKADKVDRTLPER